MNGITRVLRMALRFRWTVLGVVISSLVIGVLWSANISIIYPVAETVFLGKSMQEWGRDNIADLRQEVEKLDETLATLRRQPAAGNPAGDATEATATQRRTWERQHDLVAARRESAQAALDWMIWLQPYLDQYVPRTPFRTLLALVGLLLLGSILKDLCMVANQLLVERVVQLVVLDLRKQFYRRTLRLDFATFQSHSQNELMSRFTSDIAALATGLNCIIGKMVREPLRMVACVVGAACVSWQLLLFSLVIAPPCLLAMRWLSRSLKRNGRKALEQVALFFERLGETFSGMATVKAYGMERFERRRFHETSKAIYSIIMKITFYSALAKPVTELFGIGVICLALVAGAYLVLNQETHLLGLQMCERPLSVPGLMLFYSMLGGVSDPARKLSDIFGVVQSGSAAAERIFPLLDREPTIVDPVEPVTPRRPHGRIVLDKVSFHYRAGQPVLRGVSLEIPFGESLAIVGPNGCGKSTLVHLLTRFYDPIEGTIRLDQFDVRQMKLRDLRSRFGVVSQNTHLFDDTVWNNIRYGSPRATREQIVAAAQRAHAHRFITERLSEGYETVVGSGGNRLSGGQRQRIALARAFLRNPDVLILDEATSQIDIESEQAIHQALEEFISGRTAIMITHRLSTLSLADRIVVMDGGLIADVGTHRELLARCPVYQRLHDVQFRQSA